MKSIHIVSSTSDEASGPTYVVTELCKSLAVKGQDVTLATLDWAPVQSSPSFLKTFPLGIGPRRLGRSPAMKRWLAEKAGSREVDIFHAHGLWMMPNVYPAWVGQKYNVPVVFSPHGTFTKYAMSLGSRVKRVFWPIVQRPALKAVDCFHATAESEYEDIRRLGFTQPVAIIPSGVEVPEPSQKKRNSPRTLLFLGRIHPNKGLDLLLPAWGAVQDRFPDWRLCIVGPEEGGYLSRIKRTSRELSLNRVDFLGPLYGNAKMSAYRNADIFVLPSYSENFGVAVAEALAAETPVIVTKAAPWGGLVEHGAGWWVDISVEALIACLEEAMSCSHETLALKGKCGRSWMLEDYSWEHVAEQMEKVYKWILTGKKISEMPTCVRCS